MKDFFLRDFPLNIEGNINVLVTLSFGAIQFQRNSHIKLKVIPNFGGIEFLKSQGSRRAAPFFIFYALPLCCLSAGQEIKIEVFLGAFSKKVDIFKNPLDISVAASALAPPDWARVFSRGASPPGAGCESLAGAKAPWGRGRPKNARARGGVRHLSRGQPRAPGFLCFCLSNRP